MPMCYKGVNGWVREKGSPRARRRRRLDRRGRGLGLGLGWRASGPIRTILFGPICLKNKNAMHVILSEILNEIRESLEEEVSELNFPRSPRDSRPRAAAVAGSGSSPAL
ncbi:hypothetical protein IGI04_023509 [Brassica rapa subsp. trilocularis]|uniref:Uncharacterized protein n=1 Tax=Brassica rapa subsp. trilocularis TaxID=1813537 RepID=A0ABQ7M888_BRACM|nr:hypothetical protein IGI04_023509 [Brassica rapa subsp. trilocularis]